MVRLFVGLELPEPIKSSLDYARGGVEGARWQTDDRLHLTLAFIGETSRRQMRDVEGALSAIDFDPFEFRLSGVDMFGDTKHPKTLWAGVENEAPLRHLHEKILNALERVDVEVDRRRYRPHVTLARFQKGTPARIGDWLRVNGPLKSPAYTVDHFTLFASSLTGDGPHYSAEARFGPNMAACADWQEESDWQETASAFENEFEPAACGYTLETA
jgi:2'-5' RNA ligase